MQATHISRPSSPGWITWILLVGAVVLFAWGWFVFGFLSEPSAVGRTWLALVVIGGCSMAAAVLGLIAAAGLLRPAGWAVPMAFVAAVLMILSIVGAVAGIPALIGLVSSRMSSRN
jgi:hypothetical protein